MTEPLDVCEAIDGPSPEWYRELQAEEEDLMSNGYAYRGTGRSLSDDEATQRLSRAATTAPSALATSRQARAAIPTPAVVPGKVLPPAAEPPALKGAVKVEAFPEQCRYPFAQIAADGGVWRMDPAEWKIAKPESLRTQASAWARKHEMTAKTAISDGYVFVQFRRPE